MVGTTGAVVGVTTVAAGADGADGATAADPVVAGAAGEGLATLVEGAAVVGALVLPVAPAGLNGRETRIDTLPAEETERRWAWACPDEGSRALVTITADRDVRMAATMMVRG